MHVVVMGAGALGTLFGAAASRGGATRVTLVARNAHARAINADGIVVRNPDGELRVRHPGLVAVTDISGVEGDVDCLLFTMKDGAMSAALSAAGALGDRARCFLSLQNGVGQVARLQSVFGSEKVVGATTMEGAAMVGPGVIDHLLASTTYLGELDGARTARIEMIADIFRRGGVDTEVIGDITVALWTKFVQSCAASGVCGVTRVGFAPATRTEAGARLYVALVQEGIAVMRASGMEPGAYFTDAARVREVANLSTDVAVGLVRGLAAEMVERGYTGATSLARDLAQGRPSEADALMGEMCRMADAYGIPVPTTRAVYLAIATVDEMAARALHAVTTAGAACPSPRRDKGADP